MAEETERKELIVRRPMKRKRRGGRRLFQRKKLDRFDTDASLKIDYKDAKLLRSFLTEQSRRMPT